MELGTSKLKVSVQQRTPKIKLTDHELEENVYNIYINILTILESPANQQGGWGPLSHHLSLV